jgi:hypothetical protein
MERSSSEQWISDLKIALIEDNHQKIYKLIVDIPEFDNFEQAKEASVMIESALETFNNIRNEARANMTKMKKMREYLISNKKGKFNKTS